MPVTRSQSRKNNLMTTTQVSLELSHLKDAQTEKIPDNSNEKEEIIKVSFPVYPKNTPLFSFEKQWQRQKFIDYCRKTPLKIDLDNITNDYNSRTHIWRIPVDDNFHNTLAGIYSENFYLVPIEELYFKKTNKKGECITYMQFKAFMDFEPSDAPEKHKYSEIIAEALIGHFINTPTSNNPFINFDYCDMNRKYFTGILMYLWNQGIYVNFVPGLNKFCLEIYCGTNGDLKPFNPIV